jgi:hypothetical protein
LKSDCCYLNNGEVASHVYLTSMRDVEIIHVPPFDDNHIANDPTYLQATHAQLRHKCVLRPLPPVLRGLRTTNTNVEQEDLRCERFRVRVSKAGSKDVS